MEKKDNKGIELSLTELLAVILRGGKTVILAALVLAVLFGVFAVVGTPAQERMEALEAYQLEKETLEEELERARNAASNQESYNEKSQLMSIDPYNKITTTMVFVISGIKLEEVTDSFGITEIPISYITSRIQAQYISAWNALNLELIALGTKYEGVADKYLREVSALTALDGGVLRLEVIGNNATACEELVMKLYAALEQSQDAVIKASYEHQFAKLNDMVTKSTIDLGLEETHTLNRNKLDELNDALDAARNAYDGLKAPAVGVKDVVINAIIGGLVGGLLSAAWLICAYFAKGSISGSKQLENRYGLLYFGALIRKNGFFTKLGYQVMKEKLWKDEKQALAYLGANGSSYLPQEGTVVIVSTLETVEEAVQEALVQTLSGAGRKVQFVTDPAHSPEALAAIAQCDGIVLAERAFASRCADVKDLKNTAKHLNKNVYGFLLV